MIPDGFQYFLDDFWNLLRSNCALNIIEMDRHHGHSHERKAWWNWRWAETCWLDDIETAKTSQTFLACQARKAGKSCQTIRKSWENNRKTRFQICSVQRVQKCPTKCLWVFPDKKCRVPLLVEGCRGFPYLKRQEFERCSQFTFYLSIWYFVIVIVLITFILLDLLPTNSFIMFIFPIFFSFQKCRYMAFQNMPQI